MGKETVVETFALPKLIYPLTTLDNTPQTILDRINKWCLSSFGKGSQIRLKGHTSFNYMKKGVLN